MKKTIFLLMAIIAFLLPIGLTSCDSGGGLESGLDYTDAYYDWNSVTGAQLSKDPVMKLFTTQGSFKSYTLVYHVENEYHKTAMCRYLEWMNNGFDKVFVGKYDFTLTYETLSSGLNYKIRYKNTTLPFVKIQLGLERGGALISNPSPSILKTIHAQNPL